MPYGQKRISIGRRRERVEIQAAVITDDGMGGQAVSKWQTVGEPWAEVQALDERTKESMYAQGITARHGYHIAVPYRDDLSVKHRIIVRDTTMQIHSLVDDTGNRRRLILQVGEVQR
jgi:SPP1 family predicted phage head-tail adaptor